MEIDETLYVNCYNDIIKQVMQATGIDYSSKLQEIIKLFDETLYAGCYNATTDFNDNNFPDLHFIQEDEYDQSMDDEDKPEENSFLCYANNHYIFSV